MDKILILVELLLNFTAQAQRIGESAHRLGELIRNARAAGRDITDEELNALMANDDVARKALDEAIAAAKAEGR